MNKIKWLFTAHLGRYVLGFILSVIGAAFSTHSTLVNGWVFFDYMVCVGFSIIVIQLLVHVSMAVYLKIFKAS